MRTIHKIVFLVLFVFSMSLAVAKISIDHSFKKAECAQKVAGTELTSFPESVEV